MATKKTTTTTDKTASKKTATKKAPKKASEVNGSTTTSTAAKSTAADATEKKTASAKKSQEAIAPSDIQLGGSGDGKRVLVTGATGFLGRHIVTALQHAGYQVRALCRSEDVELARRNVEVVKGDVTDAKSLVAAMHDVTFVVHAAGAVTRGDGRDGRAWMMQVHVAGTRHVVEAACAADVSRVVHVSTSGTVAVGQDPDMVFHEDDPVPLQTIHCWPYYLSKLLAERAAFDAIRLAGDGGKTELITLNPSLALGPGDRRGSSTGDVQRFLNRQIPVIPNGGLSFVDVRDVADAAVAALTKGKHLERYLLSGLNCTCEDFFARIGEVSGVAGPALPVKVPGRLAVFGVGLLERAANLVGAVPSVSRVEAQMAAHYWYVDARKAEDQLGFKPRPPMETLLDTVRDLRGSTQVERFAS